MQQLSGLDATFLYLETPQMPMHVGALHVLELPAGYRGRFVADLRRHLANRLDAAPVLRRRLLWMPLNLANPAWVDAQPDLRQHVVEVRLPKTRKGGGLDALEAEVGRLHGILLDRSRPLWRMHVIEGLAPGPDGCRRVGVYTQLHHAAVDGQAAVALANAILDLTPEARGAVVPRRGRRRAFEPGMFEMLRGALGRDVQQVGRIVRELPSTLGTLKSAALRVLARGGDKGFSNVTLAPRTPLNVSVTGERAFATVTLPLAEVKLLGRAHGATVNDVVLMLCSSALRRYYARRRELPRKSLVAAVPVSLREAGDDSADNQASMSLVSLGTHLGDPLARLEHVKKATAAMKETMGALRSVLPTDFPSLGVPWLMEAAAALYGKAKVADRIPSVANLVISNVPGPPVPLYLAGARMLTNYPASIVVHGLALNITVQSYDQSLDFGFTAAANAMPDVRALADDLRVAFDDLRALPLPGEREPSAAEVARGVARRAGREIESMVTRTVPKSVVDAARGATAFGTAMGGAVGHTLANTQAMKLLAVRGGVAKATRPPRASAPAKRKRAR
ncbi:MAG: wax ester/triacylglycerol synthase family O-acyltransferase [Burkholderiaceae bacterium]|nr:wax ester/triacylglycerol synthase family O-acyltransferase [Burkholderiaceae bacterium]